MVFEDAGQTEGLTIWRIEDFQPVLYEKTEKYGKFHVGDSYIVLNTKVSPGGKQSWDIHFWLGDETSQDESGTAAIMAVELDDSLGGAPTQHREVQGAESDLFLSYFPNGIRLKAGGVKSGFTVYDPEDVERRLFKVKGNRNVHVSEVPVAASSLNKSDCFILDLGKNHNILVLMPPAARRMEKFRANQVANEIRDEDHAGNAEIKLIEEDDFPEFFEALGEGSFDDIPDDDGDATDAFEKKKICLYKIEDDSINLVAEDSLKQEMLETDNAHIIFAGSSGVYLWVGKEASKEEKVKVFSYADQLIADNGLPKTTRITSIVEGFETAIFKQFFTQWNETENAGAFLGRQYSSGAVSEFNIEDLHFEAKRRIAKSAGAAIGFMPDDGSGSKKVWRIEDMELVEVGEDQSNFLYNGDCYVILYTYNDSENIVYFWQGANCSIDERGASALHAARIDNEELGGGAMQVRVVQDKEPRHFIKMFAGNMVVLNGGKGSGFRNSTEEDVTDDNKVKLFRVQTATGKEDTRAVQVSGEAGISSQDAFILSDGESLLIWTGEEREGRQEEVEQATRIAGNLFPGVDATVVNMGDDGEDQFWSILGVSKDDTIVTPEILNRPILEARLFHITAKRPFEINNFKKSDLVSDDVMVLDAGDELYVWIGKDSDASEKESGLQMAKKYIDADPTSRNSDNCVVIVVKEEQEPQSFKMIFPAWE